MKAAGITKYPIKKGGDSTSDSSMSKTPPLSHLQVDSEAHFHVKPNGGIANFSAVPDEKTIEVSQRSFTKKFLSNGIVPPKEEMPFAIHLPVKAKTQPPNSAPSSPRWSVIKLEPHSNSPSPQRKRKATEEAPISPKMQRVSAQSKDASQSFSPRISSRSRSSSNSRCDAPGSSPEVEIVDVVMPSRSLRKLNTASPQSGRKKSKYFYDHKMNQNEITMNEADIAPAMSTDTFLDGQAGASKSMQCLSANSAEPGEKIPAEKRATATQTQSSDLRQSPEIVLKASNKLFQNIDEKPSTSTATHQSRPAGMNDSLVHGDAEGEGSSQNLAGKEGSSPKTQKRYSRELKCLMNDMLDKKYPSKNSTRNNQESKPHPSPRKNQQISPSSKKSAASKSRRSDECLSSTPSKSLPAIDTSFVKRERESSSESLNGKQESSPDSQQLVKKSRELKNLMIDGPEKSSRKSGEGDGLSRSDSKRFPLSTSKSTDQSNSSALKRPKKSRELTSLYKNLGEIAWAQESSFKKLMRDPNYIRHSDRSPRQETQTSRHRQKLKKRCKLFSLPKKTLAEMKFRGSKLVTSSVKEKPRHVQKPKAALSDKIKPITIKKELVEDENVFYMLNPGPSGENTKTKHYSQDMEQSERKSFKSDNKPNSLPKVKAESCKGKSCSDKSCRHCRSQEQLIEKKSLKCISFVSIKTPKDSSASTSGLQKSVRHKSLPAVPRCNRPDHSRCNGSSPSQSRSRHSEGDELILACQNASKLQVRVQPLEHTNFWNNEFYEGFRKHILDQALKALESREMDSSYAMYQDMLGSLVGPGNGRRRRPEEESLRSSARQSEGAFRYKEIVVKRQSNYMQLVLVPNTAKQNSLTVEAMKELKEALLLAKKDPNCRAVLINSSGPYFCTGIDLAPLVGNNKKQAAEEIALSIRDLVLTLGVFPKPVVAAVNGAALGFGVSLLTYCDVVLASDKATFCLPATKIGYIPEGGVTYTLPQVVGSSVASEMLIQGRRITAEQACKYGLVSEVIWPTRLMNEVIPRLQNIISQPLQGLEATKTMVRCRLWDKLKMHVERERELVCEHWASTVCQNNIKTLLQTGWLLE